MQIQNIISEIEKSDPELYEKMDTRRMALRSFARLTGRITMASLPLALGAMFNKAYAGDPSKAAVIDVLNFALTLEHLEATFFAKGLNTTSLIPDDDYGSRKAFEIIAVQEAEHVKFLEETIKSLGGTPVGEATYDYTAHGTFPNPFAQGNYPVFAAIAQTFEDTGVRAYKGQAPNLQGAANRPYLKAALQIHSVEARHASRIRKLRSDLSIPLLSGTVKPWITLAQSGIDAGTAAANAAVQLSYNGEDLTTQADANIIGIGGYSYITAEEASQAFDEPLTKEQVITIVTPFFV